MHVHYSIEAVAANASPCVATVGVFDGLHIGHQDVISEVLRQAKQFKLSNLVFVFHPSPLAFLAPDKSPRTLTSLPKKIEILNTLGVETAMFVPFNSQLQQMSPEAFVEEVLMKQLRVRRIVVGYDWQFGRGRAGNATLLRELGEVYGLAVTVVGPAEIDAAPVHSTRIREAITNGALEQAARLLGRRYSVIGRVVRGEGRGRQIGFPTANIDTGNQVLPPNGVYAIYVKLDGRSIGGVLNMGVRPTFGALKFQVEAHLFDFAEDVYDREVEVFFLSHIRDERKFPNPDALVVQIQRDAAAARQILSQTKI